MKKRRIFLTIGSLFADAGGLTKAVLVRANQLSEKYLVNIITFDLQPKLNEIVEELYYSGKLSRQVSVISIFFDLNFGISGDNIPLFTKFPWDDCSYQNVEDNIIRCFDNFGYRFYIKKFRNGEFIFIDEMDENDFRVLKKRYHFYNNKLVCVEKFRNGIFIERTVYNSVMKPKVTIWYENKKYIRLWYYSGDSIQSINFTDIRRMWVLNNIKVDDIVFFDDRIEELHNCFHDINCYKIGVFHSDHNRDKHAKYLAQTNFFDKYVFLTNKQMALVCAANNEIAGKAVVIPHPYHLKRENIIKHNRLVTISRLDLKTKDILTAILAFKKISDLYKDYTYDIYGEGGDKVIIQNKIEELGLNNRVFLKGYTKNSLDEFFSADVSLNLSYYEGFGLSILESLSMGTPVIASNVDYGPAEMVQNGINGYLCNPGDIDKVANALISILDDLQNFKSKCTKGLSKFNLQVYTSNLEKLFSI